MGYLFILEEAQAGIKIVRRHINNLRYADDTTLMAESEELKSLLMKVPQSPDAALKTHGDLHLIHSNEFIFFPLTCLRDFHNKL